MTCKTPRLARPARPARQRGDMRYAICDERSATICAICGKRRRKTEDRRKKRRKGEEVKERMSVQLPCKSW